MENAPESISRLGLTNKGDLLEKIGVSRESEWHVAKLRTAKNMQDRWNVALLLDCRIAS
jgi:hypothetical protein